MMSSTMSSNVDWPELYRIVYRKHHRVSYMDWFDDLVQDCAVYALSKVQDTVSQQATFVAKVQYKLKERYHRPNLGRDAMDKPGFKVSLDEALDRFTEEGANYISIEVQDALSHEPEFMFDHCVKLLKVLNKAEQELPQMEQEVLTWLLQDKELKQLSKQVGITPQAMDYRKNKMMNSLRGMYHEQGITSLRA